MSGPRRRRITADGPDFALQLRRSPAGRLSNCPPPTIALPARHRRQLRRTCCLSRSCCHGLSVGKWAPTWAGRQRDCLFSNMAHFFFFDSPLRPHRARRCSRGVRGRRQDCETDWGSFGWGAYSEVEGARQFEGCIVHHTSRIELCAFRSRRVAHRVVQEAMAAHKLEGGTKSHTPMEMGVRGAREDENFHPGAAKPGAAARTNQSAGPPTGSCARADAHAWLWPPSSAPCRTRTARAAPGGQRTRRLQWRPR